MHSVLNTIIQLELAHSLKEARSVWKETTDALCTKCAFGRLVSGAHVDDESKITSVIQWEPDAFGEGAYPDLDVWLGPITPYLKAPLAVYHTRTTSANFDQDPWLLFMGPNYDFCDVFVIRVPAQNPALQDSINGIRMWPYETTMLPKDDEEKKPEPFHSYYKLWVEKDNEKIREEPDEKICFLFLRWTSREVAEKLKSVNAEPSAESNYFDASFWQWLRNTLDDLKKYGVRVEEYGVEFERLTPISRWKKILRALRKWKA